MCIRDSFIRDWLGSAEPAPGEGPSIALFNGGATGAAAGGAAPPGGLPSHSEAADGADRDVGSAAERADVVAHLSMSTNTDLRTVLEKKRIADESASYAAEQEERESQGAAHSRKASAQFSGGVANGHSNNGAVAAAPDGTPGVMSAGLPQPSAPLPQSDVAAMDGMLGKGSPSETSRQSLKVRSSGTYSCLFLIPSLYVESLKVRLLQRGDMITQHPFALRLVSPARCAPSVTVEVRAYCCVCTPSYRLLLPTPTQCCAGKGSPSETSRQSLEVRAYCGAAYSHPLLP